MLIVDGALLPDLDKNESWREVAVSAMRGNQIKVIPRS